MAITVTIAASGSLSSACPVPHGQLVYMVEFPAAWDAADCTFQVSKDGGATYKNLYDEVGEVTYKAGANRIIILDSLRHSIDGYVKIRSGTSSVPVAQTADRTIKVWLEGQ